jgi:hypothetical protein
MTFHDIFTNPAKYKQHGQRKYSTMVDDRLIGIVLATKNYSYDTFALNKNEYDDLLAAMRDGRIAGAVVVGATINANGNYDPTYVGEIDAEKLALQLTGIEPRHGRFGPFYVLDDYIFGNAPF